MNLSRLIYASRFRDKKFDTKELARINESAQKNNEHLDITGSLIFGEDFFLQCLEGDRQSVSNLYNKISHDSRHEEVTILSMVDIVQRDFADWKMKFVVLTDANCDLIKEFSTSSRFNPFTMNHENALELLKALRK